MIRVNTKVRHTPTLAATVSLQHLPSFDMADILALLEVKLGLTPTNTDDRDYPPARDRSRSPVGDRDGNARIRDDPMNGRDSR